MSLSFLCFCRELHTMYHNKTNSNYLSAHVYMFLTFSFEILFDFFRFDISVIFSVHGIYIYETFPSDQANTGSSLPEIEFSSAYSANNLMNTYQLLCQKSVSYYIFTTTLMDNIDSDPPYYIVNCIREKIMSNVMKPCLSILQLISQYRFQGSFFI